MRLDLALFADAANMTADGKLNILGEFNLVYGLGAPIVLSSATLVLRIVGSAIESGDHRFGLRLRNDDGHLLWTSSDMPFALPHPQIAGLPVRAVIMVQIGPLVFPEFRSYAYEIVADGQRLDEVEVHVIRADQMPKPTA